MDQKGPNPMNDESLSNEKSDKSAMDPPEETSSHSSSSVDAKSLIKTVTKSILDAESPSNFTDSDEETDSDEDFSPSLASLATELLPPLPDEQDRKRFVGCLAAVLAQTYHYDTCASCIDVSEGDALKYEAGLSSADEISSSFDLAANEDSRDTKDAKSVARHRKRRHAVLSELLLQSADLLEVEQVKAKAFLPILLNLLQPQEAKPTRQHRGKKRQREILDMQVDEIDHLRPFLESMSRGAGFRCLSLFLIQHLVKSEQGYDARIRYAIKKLGVLLLLRDMMQDPVDVLRRQTGMLWMEIATRKFEALEHAIALKLLQIRRAQQNDKPESSRRNRSTKVPGQQQQISNQRILRGLKIGGTALVAGTLFAVSGGLAAPAIAAGVATIAGSTAATAAATVMLTSSTALASIFGVGGGSLAAYKMNRRTKGLTDFSFTLEKDKKKSSTEKSLEEEGLEAELFSTICISGWLRDHFDYQRPWGVTPSKPPLNDKLELLERFYHVHKPDYVCKSAQILDHWKGEERQLWKLLQQKYGCHPSALFPLKSGPRIVAGLTHEQVEVIDSMFAELGFCQPRQFSGSEEPTSDGPIELLRDWNQRDHRMCQSTPVAAPIARSELSTVDVAPKKNTNEDKPPEPPKHLATVWDYHRTYGGELYTVKWETELLQELCDSVADLAFDLVSGGTAQILKHTAITASIAPLVTAFAFPYALVNAANMIDGTWTLAVERADEAGKELARSLLFSTAGHRPVTLVGYSFGGRIVYSCLRELAYYQELWEDLKEQKAPKRNADPKLATMREPASIVEDAVLMGIPNHLSLRTWKACRRVVAGRLVNCYSQKDMVLSLMFQLKKFRGLKQVCGVCAVDVPGVENVDVTEFVCSHQDYCLQAGNILRRIGHGQPFPIPTYLRKKQQTKAKGV